MECFLATIFFFGCLALTFLLSFNAHAVSQRRYRIYRQLASRFRGHAFGGSWWGVPYLRFQHGESQVLVDTFPCRFSPDKRTTRVQINWPDDQFFCELRSAGRLTGVTRQEVPADTSVRTVGHFDYQVVTNDPAGMRALFTDGVQWQLDALRQCLRENALHLRIANGRLIIHKARWLASLHEVETFVQLCLDFYDQAMIAHTAGVAFLREHEAQVVDAKCPICGSRIEYDLVFCRRCKTPHHAECWVYNRICSTYGCGETDFRRPDGSEPSVTLPRPAPKPR